MGLPFVIPAEARVRRAGLSRTDQPCLCKGHTRRQVLTRIAEHQINRICRRGTSRGVLLIKDGQSDNSPPARPAPACHLRCVITI